MFDFNYIGQVYPTLICFKRSKFSKTRRAEDFKIHWGPNNWIMAYSKLNVNK